MSAPRIIPALAATLAVLATAPCGWTVTGVKGERGAQPPATTSTGTPTPQGATRTAAITPTTPKEWNSTFTQSTINRWAGGDIALSHTTPEGDTWWLFGDTITINPDGSTGTQTSSALITPHSTPHNTITPRVTTRNGTPIPGFLPATEPGTKQWPAAIIPDTPNTIWVLATNITTTGPGPWDFHVTGSTIHRYKLTHTPAPTAIHLASVPIPHSPATNLIQWGAATSTRNGTHYIYGTSTGNTLGQDVYLATATTATINKPRKWTYLDSNGKPTPTPTPIISRTTGLPHLFSVQPHPSDKHGWLLIAKQHEGAGRDIVAMAAPKPWGPWTLPTPIKATPPRGNYWTYAAITHPNIPTTPGQLLITVSQNHTGPDGPQKTFKDPVTYRPRFLNIPHTKLPTITPTTRIS